MLFPSRCTRMQTLRQHRAQAATIVAMTANAFEEDVKKSLEAGMNGHLSKPIDIKKMYALLDMLLDEEEQTI